MTGSQLYPHSNPAVVISRHLNAPAPSLADTRPELGNLDPVLAAGLAKDPTDRFARCVDFAHAFTEQAATRRQAPAAPTAPARAPRKPALPEGTQYRPKQLAAKPAQPASPQRRWIVPAAVLAVLLLIGAAALVWHPWQQRPPTTTTATSTSAESPPVLSTTSADPPPPPVAAPTSAAPAATQVITAAAVVNGQPANGYVEIPSIPSASHETAVFGCDASPATVTPDIYHCDPSAAGANVCWPSNAATLLCGDNPWDKKLYRVTYSDALPAVQPPATPMPFALLLDDGTQCRLRNGGAWGGRDDGLWPAYGCDNSQSAVLASQLDEPTSIIDRSHPLWTVKFGPYGATNVHYPPPDILTVTTAWFAGN